MKKGFTLVEMLVVISILSIFGILILTIFTRTLKGGNKAQIIGLIKQNGQAVLEQMDKTVRNADNVVCPTLTDACVTISLCKNLVVVKDGIYTRYRFVPPNNTNPAIGNCGSISGNSNGCLIQDNPSKTTDIDTGKEETDTKFRDRVCPVNNQMLQPIILTDTNLQTGVSVENGLFSRDTAAGFRDQVTIKFDLDHGVDAPAAVAGQIDAVSFQTTIQLR